VLGQSSENSSLQSCSIPCLQEHSVIIVFEPAASGHSPDKFRLRWLRPIVTGEFARSLVLFQKGLFGSPVSLSVVPAVLLDGFRLQFVPVGFDHCVQHNIPLWAEGDVMRLLQRHLEVMVDLDIAWLLLMLVQVYPQISVPPLMCPLPSRS